MEGKRRYGIVEDSLVVEEVMLFKFPLVPLAQTAFAVISNIAFPSGRNKGKIISFTFTGDEFTRSPPVAPRLPSSNLRNVFPRLSQTAPIELMFGGVLDKCIIIMWM